MTNKTENKNANRRMQLISIACGIFLLALIVVSAFAYQWNCELKELELQNQSLRAISDTTTINSMNEEIGNSKMQITALQNENEALKQKVAEYETILTENDLMPEE